jgi:hypothetical protein
VYIFFIENPCQSRPYPKKPQKNGQKKAKTLASLDHTLKNPKKMTKKGKNTPIFQFFSIFIDFSIPIKRYSIFMGL